MQLAKLAWRNVLRHRSRTAMTLMAIVAGVTSLILAGGFVEDLFHRLGEALIHSQSGHVQVGKKGFFSYGSRSPEKYMMEQNRADLIAMASLPQVADMMARVRFSALISNGRADLAVLGEGIEPGKEARLGSAVSITQGRPLADTDNFGILVGAGVARALKLTPGDHVTLLVSSAEGAMNSLDFEVSGVFRTWSKEFDARAVRITLAAAQELLASAGVNTIVLSLTETAHTDRVAAALKKMFDPERFDVRTWVELNDFYEKTVDLYRRQLGFLQLIILVMVTLGVVNIVNMAVLERIGEFGTMRALGNRDRHVFQLIVIENALLGCVGAGAGVALGAILAWTISFVGIPMPPPPNADVGYTAHIRMTPSVVVTAFLVGLFATLVAAMPPALRAMRMPVAEQLRYNV